MFYGSKLQYENDVNDLTYVTYVRRVKSLLMLPDLM